MHAKNRNTEERARNAPNVETIRAGVTNEFVFSFLALGSFFAFGAALGSFFREGLGFS